MSTLIVSIALATACIANDCFNVIVGSDKSPTPTGQYTTQLMSTDLLGYGGEVLVFKETKTMAYAIHRPYDAKNNYREKLLYKSVPRDRRISLGCINIPSAIFQKYKYEIDEVIIFK